MMNKRELGAGYERQAGKYLESHGISVREYNFRSRFGEIDIVGYDGDELVFFEVKYRGSSSKGSAADAVNIRKQYRICRVSDYYMLKYGISPDTQIRYDVIAIDRDEISWIRNAYEYTGKSG